MSEQNIKGYVCENCGKKSLKKHDFSNCIICGKRICMYNSNCSYRITVKINHNIPNGIPFLNTKSEYRLCKNCYSFSEPVPDKIRDLLLLQTYGQFFRKGDSDYGEGEWVFITEKKR